MGYEVRGRQRECHCLDSIAAPTGRSDDRGRHAFRSICVRVMLVNRFLLTPRWAQHCSGDEWWSLLIVSLEELKTALTSP
ncbi:hypothetical protein VTH06DRAFT_6635 [Thermothelomyces fergusii]